MTTLIDRITKRIDELKKSTCTKSIVDELERVKAELTAVNGVDELIKKRKHNHIDCGQERGILIEDFIADLKTLKQTPVATSGYMQIDNPQVIDENKIFTTPCPNCGHYSIMKDGKFIDKPTEETLKDSQPKEVEIKRCDCKLGMNGCDICGRLSG